MERMSGEIVVKCNEYLADAHTSGNIAHRKELIIVRTDDICRIWDLALQIKSEHYTGEEY